MLGVVAQETWALPATPLFDTADRLGRAERLGPGGPRLYVTHGGLRWEDQVAGDLSAARAVEPYARRRTVLLVRHPLDTLVSLYHYASGRFQGGIDEFVEDPVWGIDKLVRFFDLWAGAGRDDPDVALCRYEDLLADATAELTRLTGFCAIPAGPAAIDVAVARGRFDVMKAMQERGEDPVAPSTGVRILSGGAGLGLGPKVRRGTAGQWREELDPEVADRLAIVVRERVDPWFGYDA